MLIIAIPKSASSSLTETLCEIHGLTNATADINELFAKQSVPGVSLLFRYHSLPQIDEELAERVLGDEKQIYKLHMFPTEQNKRLVEGRKKVVLLRRPEEIVLAEKRAQEAYIHSKRNDFAGCSSEEEWIARSRELGLYQDLEEFERGWRELNDGQTLFLDFEEITKEPQKSVNKIEEFFGWPVSRKVKLKKERYSRHSSTRNLLRKVLRKAKRKARRIIKRRIKR